MSRRARLRPSFGFLFMLSSYLLLISLLAWGSSQPELDRVWLVLQNMRREGFSGLTDLDVQTIRKALVHHTGFSRALIGRAPIGFVEPTNDGWISLRNSHLVAVGAASGPLSFVVENRAPLLAFPVTVSFEHGGHTQSLHFAENGQQEISLPTAPRPLWVQVTLEPAQPRGDQSQKPEIRIKTQALPENRLAP